MVSKYQFDQNTFEMEACSLSKKYGEKEALKQVSFRLSSGHCLGIAGHNGSGKSTLLGLVSQTIQPSAGDLRVQGHSLLGDRSFLRNYVGYVPQYDGLLEDLTVERSLRYWSSLLPRSNETTYLEVTKLMGLSSLRKKKISELSGGMKKRVSIALVLLGRPKLLIMDEAFSALDREYSEALSEFMKSFLSQGGSILLCSHQMKDLLIFSHKLLILRKGSVVFYDEVHKKMSDPNTPEHISKSIN